MRLHDLVYDFDPAEAADRIPAWLAGTVDDPAGRRDQGLYLTTSHSADMLT